MAIQSQPSRISEPFAGSGTKNVIPATNSTPSASQAASWASGFPPECSQPISAGGCPVPRNDMNGVLNQVTQDYAFRQDGGIWGWSALADYDVQRMVRGSDGKLYWSVMQSGPSIAAGAQDPTLDTSHVYWDQMPDNDADIVHKTGAETISGAKTFTSYVDCSRTDPFYQGNTIGYIKGNTPDSAVFGGFTLHDGSEEDTSESRLFAYAGFVRTDKTVVARISAYQNQAGSTNSASIDLSCDASGVGSLLIPMEVVFGTTVKLTTSGNIVQQSDSSAMFVCGGTTNTSGNGSYLTLRGINNSTNPGVFSLTAGKSGGGGPNLMGSGNGSLTWNGQPVQTSSDERLKTPLSAVPDDVLDAWEAIGWGQFRYLDAMELKGKSARLHLGLIAQRVKAVFEERGLDACAYGILCHEEREAADEEPAVDLWMVRYTEALAMEVCCQRRRADRAEVRLAALEERLAAIEDKLNTQP